MKQAKRLNAVRERRNRRVRSHVHGTRERPRLAIFRSNTLTSAQLIDDEAGKTIVAASSKEVKEKGTKTECAEKAGALLAERAKKAGITATVVDRGSYRYHGRVKALVEAIRTA